MKSFLSVYMQNTKIIMRLLLLISATCTKLLKLKLNNLSKYKLALKHVEMSINALLMAWTVSAY